MRFFVFYLIAINVAHSASRTTLDCLKGALSGSPTRLLPSLHEKFYKIPVLDHDYYKGKRVIASIEGRLVTGTMSHPFNLTHNYPVFSLIDRKGVVHFVDPNSPNVRYLLVQADEAVLDPKELAFLERIEAPQMYGADIKKVFRGLCSESYRMHQLMEENAEFKKIEKWVEDNIIFYKNFTNDLRMFMDMGLCLATAVPLAHERGRPVESQYLRGLMQSGAIHSCLSSMKPSKRSAYLKWALGSNALLISNAEGAQEAAASAVSYFILAKLTDLWTHVSLEELCKKKGPL